MKCQFRRVTLQLGGDSASVLLGQAEMAMSMNSAG